MKNIFLWFSNFFIENLLMKWLTITLVVVMSAASIPSLKRYALPRVSLDIVNITTSYPGYSPAEVEQDITAELEEQIESIEGIKKYTSKSAESFSFIRVELADDVEDNAKVVADVESAVNKATLPKDAGKPNVVEIKVDTMPILEVGFTSEEVSNFELVRIVNNLRRGILALPEVAEVRKRNISDPELHVLVDKNKLVARKISLLEIVNAMQSSKQRLYAGSLSKGEDVKNFITTSSYDSPEEVEKIIVRATSGSLNDVVIRVGDLAKVQWDTEESSSTLKYNGAEGFGFQISKTREADVVATVDAVKDFLKKQMPMLKEGGINVIFHSDESITTRTRLQIVYQNLGVGLILVLLVLALFLSPAVAFWTALSVPMAIVVSLGIAPHLGVSINSVSLCGIIVTLGILVDNATVIGESIYTLREKGEEAKIASRNGLGMVIKPMVFAVLTTIAGFSSLLFIKGNIGEFSYEIPIMVFLMLTASLLDSSLFLPSHLSRQKLSSRKPLADFMLNKIMVIYKFFLQLILRMPYISLIGIIIFVVVCGFSVIKLSKFNLFPIEQAYVMNLNGEIAGGESKQYVNAQVEKIEDVISSLPKGVVKSYRTRIGDDFANEWSIELLLSQHYERSLTVSEVKDYIIKKVKANKDIPLAFIDYQIDSGGPPTGKPIELVVEGNDDEARKALVKEIILDMQKDGLTDIDSNLREIREEYKITPLDIGRLSMITPEEIATTLRLAFEGLEVDTVYYDGEKRDLRVKLDTNTISFNNPLVGINVLNPINQYVPINKLVKVEKENDVILVNHRNGVRQNTITARFDENKTSALKTYDFLNKRYKDVGANNNLKVIIGGEAEETSNTFISLILALLTSVLMVYVLLVVQFNHLTQPFMVIVSIPFGLIGLLFMFVLQGYSVSVVSMIGIIGFGGVVINASIIMVDFINVLLQKKQQLGGGYNRTELLSTIVEGAVRRFRPIFITTFTTIAGLAPTAYGIIGNTDSFIAPIAMAMLWGLLFGTIAGLFVVPLFYFVNEDILNFFRKNIKNRKA